MDFTYSEEQISDDEVFFGKLSLKEVKKHIFLDNNRQTTDCPNINFEVEKNDESLKIIEAHSEPELISLSDTISSHFIQDEKSNLNLFPNDSEIHSDLNINNTDDSFLKIEKMLEVLDMSTNNPSGYREELDNTLEVVEYILNSGPNTCTDGKNDPASVQYKLNKETHLNNITDVKKEIDTDSVKNFTNNNSYTHYLSGPKDIEKLDSYKLLYSSPYTPVKKDLERPEILATQSTEIKKNTPIFETPANPVSSKKSSIILKKTPSKINTYQHITSPVASYIKNCPQVPLLKDVHPKKPLPGPSSIPKPLKSIKLNKLFNKENVNLPSIAYRSAKKTKLIDIPDEDKLPQSQWAKRITSSLPKPVVIKHNYREIDYTKKPLFAKQEASFADLSLCQAEVSVCTQKSAFNKPKKP